MSIITRSVRRLSTLALSGVLAVVLPVIGLSFAPTASAAGDVCDICALTFNPADCAASGGQPYDSTETNPDGTPLDSGGGSTSTPKPSSSATSTPKPSSSATSTPKPSSTKSSGKTSSTKSSGKTSSTKSSGKTSSGKSTSGTTTSGTTSTSESSSPSASPAESATDAETTDAVVPDAPAAPAVEASGSSVTVTWGAPADGGSAITGYRVELSDGNWAEVVADQTTYTFTDLEAGDYTATVFAINAVGSSQASASSDAATTGEDEPSESAEPEAATTAAVLSVSGALTLGAKVTVSGSGLPAGVSGLVVEIHSTPTQLGTVDSDSDGAFSLEVTIPESVGAGDHTLVVLQDGTQIANQPIVVAAGAGAVGSVSQLAGIAILTLLALAGLVALTVDAVRRRRNSDEADVVLIDTVATQPAALVPALAVPAVSPVRAPARVPVRGADTTAAVGPTPIAYRSSAPAPAHAAGAPRTSTAPTPINWDRAGASAQPDDLSRR